jgi:catechol 2,3-dioxygenase-like lactoylglutathione lyase family enzyme
MKLIEVEFPSKDPEASKRFYHDMLGLGVRVDGKGLKVFDSGRLGVDFDVSIHNPGRARVSFLVADLKPTIASLRARGITVPKPVESHHGMIYIRLEDPDGTVVDIQTPSERSPDWLKDQVK